MKEWLKLIGICFGLGCVIGAGSAVTEDIYNRATYKRRTQRVIDYVNQSKEQNKDN